MPRPNAPKSRRAVELTLEHLCRSDVDVRLTLANSLPRRKGMASSTADVSASIAATAAATGKSDTMPPSGDRTLALLIEPSDGLMLPGVSLFDHRNGTKVRTLGAAPPMRVVVLDFGGDIDTIEFNSVDREQTLRGLQPRFEEALSLIVRGVEHGHPEEVAAGATLSAVANQKVLYKPQLDAVMSVADELGALGINVAHSGTVFGMLFEDDPDLTQRATLQAGERLPGINRVYDRRVVDGGVFPIAEQSAREEVVQWQR